MNFFRYINIATKVYREIKVQKQFNKTFLIPYLKELEVKYNGKFQPEQRKKILDYYGLFITSFLCSSYKRLYGKTLTDEERKRATLFGILTPVGDDLFDIDKLDNESIRQITFQPQAFNATTFSAHVAKEIQTYLLNTVSHKEEYIQASKNVLDIQVETEKQTSRSILKEEMRRITYTKGAVSVIIYHECLNEAASAKMKEVLFLIGSLYQLGNDIFDLYKDVRDNIYTLVNTCDDFVQFKKDFIERVKLQNQKIYALPYAKKDKEDFCIVMNTINARSLVAIDQFIATQKKYNNKVDWWKLQRKDMIVDMEKTKNILKWLKYIFKLPKLI
jgi:vacuolar-type H+-ATPase catalytic subunit A/Vma1